MMLSSSSLLHLSLPPKALFSCPVSFPSLLKFKGNLRHGVALLPAMCIPGPTRDTEKSEDAENMPVSSSSSSSSPSNISTYNWCVGLGGLGFLETAYLTYLKLSNSDPFCPIGAGSCSDVLNSDYAVVFGVPLPLIGMTAYGVILLLGLKLGGWNMPLKINQSDGRLLLLPVSASMAVASAYFLYILATRLEGASCSYCLASATLSFSLFFIILKDFGLQELQKVVTLPLCTAAIVLGILSTSYSALPPILPRSEAMGFNLLYNGDYFSIKPFCNFSAKILKSTGAKMYGAFWCSHCQEQKEMFGREAMQLLDYVECFPDGVKKGIKMVSACSDVGIEGFPTWLINGEVISGEKTLEELAEISGFNYDKVNQPN
ncbi:thiol-disulfide oxidoreductase LTO1-like isoform X1 [Spinacia oleracea]|uniref:Thiol-disulfide oxidoreductase LTO1-like isoform X1 n=1 Tax=Spinacia oleracea TaxID=3562 RepID=A0ABM3QPC7_SPIOL|nr:thiol-disulfide oxidoreductase LTO1-like isoform X1 [Spinacia oleracea]